MIGAEEKKSWPTWVTVMVVLLVIFFVIPMFFGLVGIIVISAGIASIGNEGLLIKPVNFNR